MALVLYNGVHIQIEYSEHIPIYMSSIHSSGSLYNVIVVNKSYLFDAHQPCLYGNICLKLLL